MSCAHFMRKCVVRDYGTRHLLEHGELNAVSDCAAAEPLVDDNSVLSYEAKLNSAQLQYFKSQDEAKDPLGP